MNPIIIHHRSVHHASNSGYSRLIDYIPNARIVDGAINFPYRIAKFISENTNQMAGSYISSSVLKEIELFKELSKKEKQVVHYLNAERDIRFIVNNKELFKNSIFSGTFHKPPEILKQQIKNTNYLKKIDKCICVGRNQVDFIKDWLNLDDVKYIPHGIDTHFFKFDITKRVPNRILFVGQHLRDFDTFNYCVKKLIGLNKDIKVKVVIREDYNKFINYNSNTTILNNINDNELRLEYQKASLLFLPLVNVTACNSILEALSCGLPIVTTDVGGNIEYLKGTNNILAPRNDTSFMIESMNFLLKSDNLEISNQNVEVAENYSWEIIAKAVLEFLKINNS